MNKTDLIKESDSKEEITAWLEIKRLIYIRNNTGEAPYQNKDGTYRRVKFGCPGMSDIQFWYRKRTVWCEVKSPKEYKYVMKHFDRIASGQKLKTKKDIHLLEQINFILNMRENGCLGFFASSSMEVEKELAKAAFDHPL